MSKPKIEIVQYLGGHRMRDHKTPLMNAETVEFVEKSAHNKAIEALKQIESHLYLCSVDNEIIPQNKAR